MQPAAGETDSLRNVRARVRVIAVAIRKNSQRFVTEELSYCVACRGIARATSAGWIYIAPDLHPPVGVCWHRASTGELTRSASQLKGLRNGGGGWSPGWRRVYLRTINRRRALLLFSVEPSRVFSSPSSAVDCPRERPRQAHPITLSINLESSLMTPICTPGSIFVTRRS